MGPPFSRVATPQWDSSLAPFEHGSLRPQTALYFLNIENYVFENAPCCERRQTR